MRSLNFLALRNLEQGRTRTILSTLAVALGVTMTIVGDVIGGSVLNAISDSEIAQLTGVELFEQLASLLTLAGVAVTAAAGFLVFNAFAMSVTQRRQQIGALRSLGMTRRQVLRLVLVEALITGGLGTLLGLVVGPLMGRGVIALLSTTDMFLNALTEGSVSLSSFLLAAVLGVGISLMSVLLPARRATRISPLDALRAPEAAGIIQNPVRSAWVGLVVMIGLVVYLLVAPPGDWVLPPWDGLLTGLFAVAWLTGLALILPALVGGLGDLVRRPLARRLGAGGRLIADNLQRGRGRVTLTIATLVVGLTMIVGTTGFITFFLDELFGHTVKSAIQQRGWVVSSFQVTQNVADFVELDSLQLLPEAIAKVEAVVDGRGEILGFYFAVVPELSFMGSNYFSFVLDPQVLRETGDTFFTLTEGDWETAMPIMETGCGLLLTPLVAQKNNAWLGDTLTVQGVGGDVECTIVGIGQSYVSASIISGAVANAFGATDLLSLYVSPSPDVAPSQLEADLNALADRHPGIYVMQLDDMEGIQQSAFDQVRSMLNGMLLLAIVSAALGVVNTTVMSVTERRRELGLLRAVGATRRQVSAVVAGEAALMGLIGGGLGLVAGAGITVILATVYGGNGWGIPDLDLWGAAWRSVQPALFNGLVGLIAAPFICAGAAWLPTRSLLRGSAIETMEPERQETGFFPKNLVSPLSRGSIRARFVLGTATLMTVVLAGLIGVVTTHARVRIEEQMHDALRTMVAWNTGMIELGLPDDAETLDFDTLMAGGGAFNFDSDALLRFESLVDDMTANGLVDFTIADRDDVVLISLDMRDIGTLAPELETTDGANVYSEREGDEWLMYASAPIRNEAELVVGSVRLTVDAREIREFLGELRNTLWAIGAAIVLAGVAVSWWLSTPLVRATRQLAAHAAGVGRGEHILFERPRRGRLAEKLSLRARLTIALVLIVALMVAALEVVAIPIERRHVEDTLKDSLIAAAEWIGQAISESLDLDVADMPFLPTSEDDLQSLISNFQFLDLARLQELGDQMRSDDMAYTALVNEEGTITLSDQLALIGEEAPLPSDTQIEETTWRGEDVWVVSTPLRHGRDGEQIGALRMAVQRNRVEAFLDESRYLFRLTGLIAVLAGVLLAQGIGGAVTAPVRQLAAGTRRVAAGDLSVQFRVDTKDELALLANAYNQMVIGLQEREWLRDMFGRFVSHEVAEALRTGQVRLKGENRVVSILFCDIRDFTARSERHTPEEIVTLLNEYLPVVVEAAQRHEGTVNKFGGDSTLVIYGAPNRLQESAYQAVLTALEMRANLQRLNERLAERDKAPIRIGVGINTGMALAGAVGPPERQEYTVIGDTVNLASRIESLNKAYPDYDVLISGWTYEALGSRRAEFEFADLGEVQIRGKVEPVRVWAVVKKM